MGCCDSRGEQGFEHGRLVGESAFLINIASALNAGEAVLFEVAEVLERGVELCLESAHVAAEQVGAMAGGAGFFPCLDDEADAVDAFKAGGDFFDVDFRTDIEKAGFHHDEAFEAPIEIGNLFDEAHFGLVGGAQGVDEGVVDFIVFGGGFGGEEGVDVGSESVADGGAGGVPLALGGGGSFRFAAVDAGLVGLFVAGLLLFGGGWLMERHGGCGPFDISLAIEGYTRGGGKRIGVGWRFGCRVLRGGEIKIFSDFVNPGS